MTSLKDPAVRELLADPNYAVISTLDPRGAIHQTVVWVDREDGTVAVNSAIGRKWPANLERDPRVSLLVYESGNPYHYVEIRGRAKATRKGADEHIDRLAKKYTGKDRYPYRQPGEQRIKFEIRPEHVRHIKQQ